MYSPSPKSHIYWCTHLPIGSSFSELSEVLSPRLQFSLCLKQNLTCNSPVVYFKSTEGTRKVCSPYFAKLNWIYALISPGWWEIKVCQYFLFQSSLSFSHGELENLALLGQIWERIPVSRASAIFWRCMIFQMLWAALSFHWSLSTKLCPTSRPWVLRVLCPGPHMPPLLGFYQPPSPSIFSLMPQEPHSSQLSWKINPK